MAVYFPTRISNSYRGTSVIATVNVPLDVLNNIGRSENYVFQSVYLWSDNEQQLKMPFSFVFVDEQGNEQRVTYLPKMDSYQRQYVISGINTFNWFVNGLNRIEYDMLPNTNVEMIFTLAPNDHLSEMFIRVCRESGLPKGIMDTMKDVALRDLYEKQAREGVYTIDDVIEKLELAESDEVTPDIIKDVVSGEVKEIGESSLEPELTEQDAIVAKDVRESTELLHDVQVEVIDTTKETESEERAETDRKTELQNGVYESEEKIVQFKPIDVKKIEGIQKANKKKLAGKKLIITETTTIINIPLALALTMGFIALNNTLKNKK